jgi:hypothetical protein
MLAVTLDLASQVAPAPMLDGTQLPINANVNASTQINGNQSEMSVVVDPTNPLRLAGFSARLQGQGASRDQIDVFYSADGGNSWTSTTIDDGSQGINDGYGSGSLRGDPTIAFDEAGILYIGYVHRNGDTDRIIVAKSIDHGATFSGFWAIDTENTVQGYVDKPHLATGPDGPNSSNQAVYIAYSKGSNNSSVDIWTAGSNDAGNSFASSQPMQVSDIETDVDIHFRLFARPAVGSDGALYVSWADHIAPLLPFGGPPTTASLKFDVDLDGFFSTNESFGTDINVRTLTEPLFPGESFAPAQPTRGIHTGPVLDVYRSGNPTNDRLYITWTDAIDANFDTNFNSDIFLATSEDHGATWSQLGNIGNVEDSIGTDFLPWVDVDQSTGSVNVIYYTTDGNPDAEVDVRLATSVDGGNSFQYATLSRATSDESGGSADDYLEYIGLDVHDGTVHGLWASRVSAASTDLEPLTARASLESVSGTNLLTVTGDDSGVTDDVIKVRLSPANNDFLEVLINGTLEFAGLMDTIDQIDVDGLLGVNTYLIDPNISLPVTLPPPRVKSVIISKAGTTESYDFSTARYDDITTQVNEDEPVIGSGNQLRTVPVGGADTVSIVFDQAVNVDANDLGLIGASAVNATPNVPTLAANGYSYDEVSYTATWTYELSFIGASDFYLAKLTDGVSDGSSTGVNAVATGAKLLDGEWTNPANIDVDNTAGVSVFPSGDGTAGGDFQFVFTILPDFDQNNLANSGDLAVVLTFFNSVITTFAEGDFNGLDGTNSSDLALLLTVFNANLEALILEVDRAGDPYTFDQDDVDWYIQNNQEDDPLYLAFSAFKGLYGDIAIDVAS